MKRIALVLSAVAITTSCAASHPSAEPTPLTAAPAPPAPALPAPVSPPVTKLTLAQAGLVPEWMDRTVDPCVDFYEFACGGLMKTAVIPPEERAWGVNQILDRRTDDFLHTTLDGLAKDPGSDPARQKLGAFYGACLDEPAIEKSGLAPLAPLFAKIDAVRDTKTLFASVTALHVVGLAPLFDLDAGQDFADATLMIGQLDQDGLGLPDRDYYFPKDAHGRELLAAYPAHVERTFVLGGDKPAVAKKRAADVLTIETALAGLSQTRVERRDPHAIYHPMDRAGLAKLAPHVPWTDYLAGLGLADATKFTVNSLAYFQGVDALVGKVKPEAWRSYLRWHLLRGTAVDLGKAFVDEDFAWRQRLSGAKENEPRWRRCLHETDRSLGELLGQIYVEQRFSPAAKADVKAMLGRVREAMGEELDGLAWMDAKTRAAAKEKLGKLGEKIGYPDAWRKYDFAVSPTDHPGNVLAWRAWERHRRLAKIGKPLDRTEWDMTPPTNNAYYDSSMNEMVFPAGILQPPFYDEHAVAAVNYGGTAYTMGHELTHSFDDEGSQFDGDGNLRDWWSEGTSKEFHARTQCVAEQYGAFEVLPGLHVNGKLTVGEDIADLGGVKIGLAALHRARAGAKERVVADGFDEDQLYFLGFAQGWCEKLRPETMEQLQKTDPHAPEKQRVNGGAQDTPAFAAAFSCKAGAPMAPANRCEVW